MGHVTSLLSPIPVPGGPFSSFLFLETDPFPYDLKASLECDLSLDLNHFLGLREDSTLLGGM